VLWALSEHPATEVTVDELATNVADRSDRLGDGTVATLLVHVHLPVLSDAGLVSYEPVRGVVRGRNDSLSTALLQCAAAEE
jgi:hypothetical protein